MAEKRKRMYSSDQDLRCKKQEKYAANISR